MATILGAYTLARSEDNRALDVQSQYLRAPYRACMDIFTGDYAQNDVLQLPPIPDHAVLSEALSFIQHSALGASVTLDLGFLEDTRPEIQRVTSDGAGITSKEDFLIDGANVSSAGTIRGFANLAIASKGKQLWELAGLTRSSGLSLTLIATLGGANPASGTIFFELPHTTG